MLFNLYWLASLSSYWFPCPIDRGHANRPRFPQPKTMIKSRPIFISILCYYLLISGCYFLFTSFANLKQPETQAAMDQVGLPFALQVAMLYLNLILTIVCAKYIMQEANWARWVYLGWGFINIDYHLYIASDWHQNILPVAVYLVSAVVLLVPSAHKYFATGFDPDDML